MNLISKCNCCVCEPVCKYKTVYKKAVESILEATIPAHKGESEEFAFWKVKNCPHVDVSIKCPHMVMSADMKLRTVEANNA